MSGKRGVIISVRKDGKTSRGAAELVSSETSNTGYLWLSNEEGFCIGWIEARQLDAIVRRWQIIRGRK